MLDPKPMRRIVDPGAVRREQKRAWKERNRERQLERERERRARLREEGVDVECPDCGQVRHLRVPPVSRRCRSCANKRPSKYARTCPNCGKRFAPDRDDIRFCSQACRIGGGGYADLGKKLARRRTRAGNPNYRHGQRVGARKWGLLYKTERECRNCGAGADHLHHAIPKGKADSARDDLRNGLPLCRACHEGWHYKKVVIPRTVFTEEEWEYLQSVTLTGEQTDDWLDRHYPEQG